MSSTCPACGEQALPGASFCEACGTGLEATDPTGEPAGADTGVATAACVACGAAGTTIEGGYCLVCGHKQPGPRDHLEIDLGSLAGVTDRGQRHHRNEDAMALAHVDGSAVLVVCDGVSTTDNPEQASQAAADAALSSLVAALIAATDQGDGEHPMASAMAGAVQSAQAAVVEVPVETDSEGNPSCTFVAAVAQRTPDGIEVTVGWLGDSRAYWLGEEPLLLTDDHSWATAMVAAGELTEAEAAADHRAGVITRWLGRDAPDTAPDVAHHTFDAPGRLLLCSDGFWNYADKPHEVAELDAWTAPTTVEQAAQLVAHANISGGHDNITAVLLTLDPVHASSADPEAAR